MAGYQKLVSMESDVTREKGLIPHSCVCVLLLSVCARAVVFVIRTSVPTHTKGATAAHCHGNTCLSLSVPACTEDRQTAQIVTTTHHTQTRTHALVFQIDSGHTNTHTHTQSTKWCKSLSPSFGNSLDSSRRKRSRSSNPQSKVFLLPLTMTPFFRGFSRHPQLLKSRKDPKKRKVRFIRQFLAFSLQKGFFLMSAHCLPFPHFLLHGCPPRLHRYHGSIKRGFQFPNDGENSAPTVRS